MGGEGAKREKGGRRLACLKRRTGISFIRRFSPALCEQSQHVTEVPLVLEERLVLRVVLKGHTYILRVPTHINNLSKEKRNGPSKDARQKRVNIISTIRGKDAINRGPVFSGASRPILVLLY